MSFRASLSLYPPSFVRLLGLLVIIFLSFLASPARAHNETITFTSTRAAVTRVVQIFYIDERAYEGLPYTLLHRDSGSVMGTDTDRITYIITTTRVDQRPKPTHSRTDNVTTGILTLKPSNEFEHMGGNATGQPSTITQGPATFLFTGARFSPNHTVINRCSLNGTVSAACNLTHVGSVWYTKNADWNGTYSTYSYNWTSGDRFGFAPVTITEGAELLGDAAVAPTASGMRNAAAAAVLGRPCFVDINGIVLLVPAFVMTMGVALGLAGALAV